MSAILCRLTANHQPIVFIADSYDASKKQINAWMAGDKVEPVTLDVYHQTLPLSADDEQLLSKRYAKATGDKEVFVRHRLPRQKRQLVNILTKPPKGVSQLPQEQSMQPATRRPRSAQMPQEAPQQAASGVVAGIPATNTSVDFDAAIQALQAEFQDKIAALTRAKATT